MGRRELLISLAVVAFIVGGGLLLQNGQDAPYLRKPYVQEKILLDTHVFIKAYGQDESHVEKSVAKAFAAMEEIDQHMNYFDEASELARLNRVAPHRKAEISPDLAEVLNESLEYGKKTNGAFNIAVAPIMDLWRFGDNPRVPSRAAIAEVLPLVDLDAVRLDRKNRAVWFEKKGVKLDLGAVAKGYAVEKAIHTLKGAGISRALVSAGSITAVIGSKPGDKGWKIGVKHPRKEGDSLLGTVVVRNKNVSTSGDYQQFFRKGKNRYHHLINPRTGYPAEGVISATVITGQPATEADILSTAVFVMGYPQGLDFINEKKNLEGVVVTSDGAVHLSEGLKHSLKHFPSKLDR